MRQVNKFFCGDTGVFPEWATNHPEPPSNAAAFVLNCHGVANPYKSNGYEDVAAEFIAGRGRNSSGVGASVVADWSQTLPSGATLLDLGCGTGVQISQPLIERGFKVYGVDASPTIVAAFRARLPINSFFRLL